MKNEQLLYDIKKELNIEKPKNHFSTFLNSDFFREEGESFCWSDGILIFLKKSRYGKFEKNKIQQISIGNCNSEKSINVMEILKFLQVERKFSKISARKWKIKISLNPVEF